MPPPSQKGKGKGKALAGRGSGQSEDHSFDEVVSEHSKNLEELKERQKVCLTVPFVRTLAKHTVFSSPWRGTITFVGIA